MRKAVESIITTVEEERPREVRLANAYCVALADRDESYGRLMKTRGINLPDGTPVALLMRLKNAAAQPRRVRGPSFFESVLAASEGRDVRHFFLGTNESSLRKLTSLVHERYPFVDIVGSFAPPYTNDLDEIVALSEHELAGSEANLIWVALGTPKQDFVASALVGKTGITAVGVGAAFDFMTGDVAEAPEWVSNIGAEWLFRFASEPRRLWRRYVLGNIQFLQTIVKRW